MNERPFKVLGIQQIAIGGPLYETYCASCHVQEDCVSCHEGSVRPAFHHGNYLAEHPRDAMANNPPCASCHRLDKFCRDCHFRAGVSHLPYHLLCRGVDIGVGFAGGGVAELAVYK